MTRRTAMLSLIIALVSQLFSQAKSHALDADARLQLLVQGIPALRAETSICEIPTDA